EIGNQALERACAQARHDRPALRKGLQNAVELELAQGLADVPPSDTELRRELALRRQTIARLERAIGQQVPDLAHDQVRGPVELDRAQLGDDRGGFGHAPSNWLTSDYLSSLAVAVKRRAASPVAGRAGDKS